MNIKTIRKQRNLTQKDVAASLGVGQSAVAMWETGQSVPRAAVLIKMAGLFGCSVDDLLGIKKPGNEIPEK